MRPGMFGAEGRRLWVYWGTKGENCGVRAVFHRVCRLTAIILSGNGANLVRAALSFGPDVNRYSRRKTALTVPDEEKLKLGKGVAFVKSRLNRLPESDEIWEADFQALPRPIMENETPYLGMVDIASMNRPGERTNCQCNARDPSGSREWKSRSS